MNGDPEDCGVLGFQSVIVPWGIYCREKRLQPLCRPARVRAFFNAPVVIFHLNILSYFAFLCLFAYVLMVDFQPSPSWCEYLIYLWLFSLVCEETRQVLTAPTPSVCHYQAPSRPPESWVEPQEAVTHSSIWEPCLHGLAALPEARRQFPVPQKLSWLCVAQGPPATQSHSVTALSRCVSLLCQVWGPV